MNEDVCTTYIEAASKHGRASITGDHIAANKAHRALMSALKQFRSSPDSGRQMLTTLLGHPDAFVVCWAGTHLLQLDEVTAKSALCALAKNETDLAAFNAKMVLREWDAGRLVTD